MRCAGSVSYQASLRLVARLWPRPPIRQRQMWHEPPRRPLRGRPSSRSTRSASNCRGEGDSSAGGAGDRTISLASPSSARLCRLRSLRLARLRYTLRNASSVRCICRSMLPRTVPAKSSVFFSSNGIGSEQTNALELIVYNPMPPVWLTLVGQLHVNLGRSDKEGLVQHALTFERRHVSIPIRKTWGNVGTLQPLLAQL